MEFNATFLVTIISFIMFVILMNKILYAPILNVMEERKNFIDGNYKSAQENNQKVEKLNQKREEKLLEAKNEAKEKFIETLDEFKSQKLEALAVAENNASAELENSRIELEDLSSEAKECLKNSMTDLASDIVEKMIGYKTDIQGFDDNTINEILYK